MLSCVLAMIVVVPCFVVSSRVEDSAVVLGIKVEGTFVVLLAVVSASTVVESCVV